MAKASEAKILANERWEKKSYDKVLVRMPKGALEQIRAAADAAGVSVNRYILEALEARSGLKLTLDNALPWMNSETGK